MKSQDHSVKSVYLHISISLWQEKKAGFFEVLSVICHCILSGTFNLFREQHCAGVIYLDTGAANTGAQKTKGRQYEKRNRHVLRETNKNTFTQSQTRALWPRLGHQCSVSQINLVIVQARKELSSVLREKSIEAAWTGRFRVSHGCS